MENVRLIMQASDTITYAGLASLLTHAPEVTLLGPGDRTSAKVLVFACEQLTTDMVTVLRRSALETCLPVVLVIKDITDSELLVAVECRVVAILPRTAVTGEQFVHAIRSAAAGGGIMPPNLVGELLKHIERLQREVLAPNGLNASGLTAREVDVLRLMAEGLDTHEISGKLCYSERTVKNVIYGVTHRFKLRNRSHAIAYALRAGAI